MRWRLAAPADPARTTDTLEDGQRVAAAPGSPGDRAGRLRPAKAVCPASGKRRPIAPDADKIQTHKDSEKHVKVIAGKFKNAEGHAKGHNIEPLYFDIKLEKDKKFNFDLPSTHNSFIYLISGEIKIGEQTHNNIKDSTLILLTRGEKLKVSALTNAKFLLISGKPIGEQIARGGPFVMNTKAEILQAVQDYHNGTFVK